MPRVSYNKAATMEMPVQKGFRMFKNEVGKRYHIIFLAETVGQRLDNSDIYMPIQYRTVMHKVGNKGVKVKCSNIDLYKDLDPQSVLRKDADGNVLNDGTCPFCEADKLFKKKIFANFDEFKANNPGFTELEKKAFFKSQYNKQVIKDPEFHNAFLVAVIPYVNGQPEVDETGNIRYEIMGMEMTESRFTKKLAPAVDVAKMGALHPDDDGISWGEFYFNFPFANTGDPNKDKQEAGKDLTISSAPRRLLDSNPTLFAKLKEEVAQLDFDAIEETMYVFKLKTLEEMERELAKYVSKDDLAVEGQPTSDAVSVEEAQAIMSAGVTPSTQQVAPVVEPTVAPTVESPVVPTQTVSPTQTEEKGAAAFDVGSIL